MNPEALLKPQLRHRKQMIERGGPVAALARLSQFSERRGVVLDVGLNRGTVALLLARLYPDLPIHLIEPIPAQCRFLEERFARFANLRVHQLALSDRGGTADFHIADHTGSSSLFTNSGDEAARHSTHATTQIIAVDLARLDDWSAAQGISHIACMKIDAQGSEFSILQGARRLLSNQAIDMIMLEWFALPHYDGVPLLDEILSLMRGHGYWLYDIFPSKRLKNGQLRFGDAVFISDRFRRDCLPAPSGPEQPMKGQPE
jgi:FkbM family methyltransferase